MEEQSGKANAIVYKFMFGCIGLLISVFMWLSLQALVDVKKGIYDNSQEIQRRAWIIQDHDSRLRTCERISLEASSFKERILERIIILEQSRK